MRKEWLLAAGLSLLAAGCSKGGEAGEACTVDEDCAEGLVCHVHDGEEGECEDAESEEEHEDHGSE